jgi:transposase
VPRWFCCNHQEEGIHIGDWHIGDRSVDRQVNDYSFAKTFAKNSFQVCGVKTDGVAVFNRSVSRTQLIQLLSDQKPCIVAMEACATAHFWARAISALGHEVRLVPPAYVKPFVKRQKNDAADAEAIAEAASRPTMRFVEPKTPKAAGARDGVSHP